MEAEYVVCSSAIQEVVWLRRFFQNIRVVKKTFEPVTFCYDNMAALAYAKDPKYHGKTKHIHIRYHFIKDMITQNEMVMKHIPTNDTVAYPFTKPIVRDEFCEACEIPRLM